MAFFSVHSSTCNPGEALLTIVLWFHQRHQAENTLRHLPAQEKWQLVDSKIDVDTPTDAFLQLKFWPSLSGVINGADARILDAVIAAASAQWGVIRKVDLVGTERNPLTGDLPEF